MLGNVIPAIRHICWSDIYSHFEHLKFIKYFTRYDLLNNLQVKKQSVLTKLNMHG